MPKKPDQDMDAYLREMHAGGVHPARIKAHKTKGKAATRITHTRKMQHRQQAKSSRKMPFARMSFPKKDERGFY